MLTRVISGIVLVIAALITILAGGYVLAAVLLLLSLIGYCELMKACRLKEEKPQNNGLMIIGSIGIVLYYLLMAFTTDRTYLFLAIIMILVAFMFLYVLTFPKYHAEQVMSALFNVVYAPVMLSCIYLVRSLPYGEYSVWMIFISSWICDTCAYFVGVAFGKHKMSPKLSPKKSIEGAIGGIAGSAVVGALYAYFIVERVIAEQQITWIFVVISAVGAVISQIGDLAASAIKRNHDIKDYGKLIPGHGGVMDRFDSVIFTAPMIYLLVHLLIRA